MARQGLVEDEGVRSARLLDAQAKAAELFAAIEPRGIIAPGVREIEASDAIRDLAADDVRGQPALAQADRPGRAEHPAAVQAEPAGPRDRRGRHRVPATSGPSSSTWEADFGRTYVLGDDPVKLRLRDALPVMFRAGRRFFEAHEDVTGEQWYAHMTGLAEADGWTFGGAIAGHLVRAVPAREDRGR